MSGFRGTRLPSAGLPVALTALVFAACARDAPPADPAELLTIRTMGLAFLEENRLDDAEAEFLRLIGLAPDEPLGHANLGLTYLRMGRLEDAEREVRRAIELAPQGADVRLILAEILRAQERDDDARAALEAALEADPGHVKSLYALASLDADSVGPGPAARRAGTLQRVVEEQPGNAAALVELVVAELEAGNAEAAAVALETLRQLVPELPVQGQDLFDEALDAAQGGDAGGALAPARGFANVMRTTPVFQQGLIELRGPGGVLVGFPLVTFSETLGAEIRDAEAVLAALRFTDATEAVGLDAVPPGPEASLALADYDQDGDADVLVGGRLFRNTPTGFEDVTRAAGLEGPPATDALFGDFDNDGLLDVYLARAGRGALLRNRGDGGFEDLGPGLGLALVAGAPLFLDHDQDGDLDLLVASPDGVRLYRNDLDGTLTDMSALGGVQGLTAANGAAAHFGDLDDDDDLDVVLATGAGGARLLDNLRAGRFDDVTGARGLATAGAAGIVDVGDYDNDGALDLLTAGRGASGLTLHRNVGAGAYETDGRPTALFAAARGMRVEDAAFIDFDNDGWLDVALAGEPTDGGSSLRLLRNAGPGRFDDLTSIVPEGLPGLRRIAVDDFGDDGDLDLHASTADGRVVLLRNDGGNGNRYLKMQLVGLGTGSGKNNHFALGAKVEVRAGALYQSRVVTDPDVHIGLGQHARADVVRVRWPNGVPQNLFYPDANQSVVEEQILKGSCLFLYAWNGERFEFVTDVMWKSALGMPVGLMALGEAAYAPPDVSQEYLRIPGEMLVPRDGAYLLQVTEELWEVAYLDEVELIAVDHPDSVDVLVDERFVFPVPGARDGLTLHQMTRPRLPRAAVDGRGRDVLDELRAADDRYVAGFRPLRYQGLSELHDLVLDLGDFPADAPVKLYLRGWIFPTDASINVALSQSDSLATVMPYLEVVDRDGRWVRAVDALSFPAGKNKLVVQDLTGLFPGGDHRVRIRTNLNVFWDHAFFTVGETAAPVRLTRLEPTAADFHYRGFSALYRKGGRFGPHWFDYARVSTESPWRPIVGSYTRYGDVLPLLGQADDRYPIIGPGDEITLRFEASDAPELPEGWTRDFLIYTEGWIKDADLNTALGWQVEPLPFHAMTRYPYGPEESYPHPDMVRDWHTRAPPSPAPLQASPPGGSSATGSGGR